MIVSLIALIGVLGILTITIGLNRLLSLFNARRFASLFASLFAITLLFFTSSTPALAQTQIAALGSADDTVTMDEDSLKTNPGGGHYSGIEYTQRTGAMENSVSDDVIEKSIKSEADDRVVVAVANGSVRLSGRVDDRKEAKNLISKIKDIPGVHEITFDLGLDELDQ